MTSKTNLPDDLEPIAKAAKCNGVSASSIYYWCDTGKPAGRFLRRWRIATGVGERAVWHVSRGAVFRYSCNTAWGQDCSTERAPDKVAYIRAESGGYTRVSIDEKGRALPPEPEPDEFFSLVLVALRETVAEAIEDRDKARDERDKAIAELKEHRKTVEATIAAAEAAPERQYRIEFVLRNGVTVTTIEGEGAAARLNASGPLEQDLLLITGSRSDPHFLNVRVADICSIHSTPIVD